MLDGRVTILYTDWRLYYCGSLPGTRCERELLPSLTELIMVDFSFSVFLCPMHFGLVWSRGFQ